MEGYIVEKIEKPNFRLNNFLDIKNATISVMRLALSNQIGTKKADMLLRALNTASNSLKLHYEKEKIVEMNEQLNKLLQASSIDIQDNTIAEKETMEHNENIIGLYNIYEPGEEEPEEDIEDIEIIENIDLF